MALSKEQIARRIKSLVGNPLFEAARRDDVGLMKAALASGRSLNERRPDNGFTPLHTAALNGSNRFLGEALQWRRRRTDGNLSSRKEFKAEISELMRDPEADPWIRDNKGMLPIDHAEVRRDREAMRLLFDAMYPEGRVPFSE